MHRSPLLLHTSGDHSTHTSAPTPRGKSNSTRRRPVWEKWQNRQNQRPNKWRETPCGPGAGPSHRPAVSPRDPSVAAAGYRAGSDQQVLSLGGARRPRMAARHRRRGTGRRADPTGLSDLQKQVSAALVREEAQGSGEGTGSPELDPREYRQ